MRLLLDTHALIWALGDDQRLSERACEAIGDRDNEILISAVSAMEVTTKYRLGKLPQAEQLAKSFLSIIRAADYMPLAISVEHAATAGNLEIDHKDPLDRLLIAEAQLEYALMVSN